MQIRDLRIRWLARLAGYQTTNFGMRIVNASFERYFSSVEIYSRFNIYSPFCSRRKNLMGGHISHWGKQDWFTTTAPVWMKLHGKISFVRVIRSFIQNIQFYVMTTYDPNEIYINNFGRRLKRKGTKVDINPMTTRFALLNN